MDQRVRSRSSDIKSSVAFFSIDFSRSRSDSSFQLLVFLLLWGQRLALRGDARAFLLKLANPPTAQNRLANAE